MSHYGPSRELVVTVCRTLLDGGYLKATEGNVSVRVSGEDAYAITPSSYDYGRMEPGDICVLGLDGRRILGAKKASIEASMHAAVYERRPDVSVIIHTHQPYASALALMERPIPALFDEQVRYLGRSVELVPYAPSGTSFLKKNVAKKLASGANAYILENHGVLVLGGDAEQAVHNMALLEKVALDYLLALLTDGRAEKVPLPIREIAFAKLRKDEKRLAAQVEEARAAREAAEAGVEKAAGATARAAAGGPATAAAAVPAGPGVPSGAQLAGYAISRYPDVAEVYRRLDELVSRPLRPIRRDAMDGYLDWFDAECRRSRELTDQAAELIPGGVQHNLAFNYPFPLAIEKAEGARLWDVDGNEYIDFLQAGGPTVLGSNYEPVRRQVAEVVEQSGPVTGLFHKYELKLAELVNRLMPACEMFRMLGSGTESVMAAVRAARAFTGKKWVVKVGGAYHGWSDQMVYG
ncbi:MAG TPA: aminotransferase class III-fold pyridoxal phosphate-dependent enzyme, partial [Thermoleophilia bacterium]|nr:aminotransferase class III-fold pyridoxal phosphate-dependent enzyme [Thermoleophilia bacterium]